MTDHKEDYSEKKFWAKIKKFSKKAGSKLIFTALELYYTYRKPNVPKWAKATILGALGYFISTIDAIPDIIPFTGFTDDLGVLALAVGIVSRYMDDETHAKAQEKFKQIFKTEYKD